MSQSCWHGGPRLRRGARPRHPADTLAFVGLLKRSVSTLRAAVNTLAVVADRHAAFGLAGDEAAIRRDRARALRAYRRRLARYGVLSADDERAQADLEAEAMAADLHAAEAHETALALRALIQLGEAAARRDPKLHALAAEVTRIRANEPDANILVYTEYADSQDAAMAHLRADPAISGTILSISGADPDERRTEAADRFASAGRLILISTDSLAEGLNLQQRCRHLLHLDLPYNPNRLEQRNGRIDRYGQRHDPDIRYLYLAGTFEERLLLRLIAKYEQARAALDVMPDTLGVTADSGALGAGLIGGFAEDQAPLFPPPPSPIRTLDRMAEETNADAYRDLLREIDRAFAGFEHMAARHGWLTGLGAISATSVPPGATRAIAGCSPLGFLRAACGVDPDGTDPDCLVPPPDWHADLSGLPGHDPAIGGLRVTADPACLRDAQGRELAHPGWAHPLVRRSADRMRLEPPSGPDPRVAVARRPGPARAVQCAFYLEGIEQADDPARIMAYDRAFIDATGGPYQTLIELRGPADLALAQRLFAGKERFGAWCDRQGLRFGRDLHMTDDSGLFAPIGDGAAGWCILHEGKTFHQYTDRWDTAPRYQVRAEALLAKPRVAEAVGHFRLAFRDIARSNDERSMIATILPPGVVLGHTATVEKTPGVRPLRLALALCGVFNSFSFDWLTRQKTATHLSLYLLDGLPMPVLSEGALCVLADTTAALCANDARYAPLVGHRSTWPVVPDPAERWRRRAVADAVVAVGYGLGRDNYTHVLSGFSHASWPSAPEMCLAAFDAVA